MGLACSFGMVYIIRVSSQNSACTIACNLFVFFFPHAGFRSSSVIAMGVELERVESKVDPNMGRDFLNVRGVSARANGSPFQIPPS